MARNVVGIERVSKLLANYPEQARAEIVHALNKSAEEIRDDAKALVPGPEAPYGTGELRSAIEVRQTLEGFDATGAVGNFAAGSRLAETGLERFIGVFPGFRGDKGWYAAFVEFGTAPRQTGIKYQTRGGKSRTVKAPQKAGGALGDFHPGTEPQPFMFPAWNANRQRALGRIKRAITKAAKMTLGAK